MVRCEGGCMMVEAAPESMARLLDWFRSAKLERDTTIHGPGDLSHLKQRIALVLLNSVPPWDSSDVDDDGRTVGTLLKHDYKRYQIQISKDNACYNLRACYMSFFHQEGQDSNLQYDDAAFLYFIASALIVVALPVGYSLITSILSLKHTDSKKLKSTIFQNKLQNFRSKQVKRLLTKSLWIKILILVAVVIFLIQIYEQSHRNQNKLKGFDPYEILGLKRDATPNEIKKAYRVLAREYHPDKNAGNPQAQKKFIMVSKSYECFTDEKKKENCFKFGNPDGTDSFRVGIGLPNFFIKKEYMYYVLPVVLAIFLIIIPGFMLSWNNKYREVDAAGISISSYPIIFKTIQEPLDKFSFLYFFAAYKELQEETDLGSISPENKAKLNETITKIPALRKNSLADLNDLQLNVLWQILKYTTRQGNFSSQKFREQFEIYLNKTRDFIMVFIDPEYHDALLYGNPEWKVQFFGAGIIEWYVQFERDYYNRSLVLPPNPLSWIHVFNISDKSIQNIVGVVKAGEIPTELFTILQQEALQKILISAIEENQRQSFTEQLNNLPRYFISSKLKVSGEVVKGISHVEYAQIYYKITKLNKNSGYRCLKHYPYPQEQELSLIIREGNQILYTEQIKFIFKEDEYIGKVSYRTSRLGKHDIRVYAISESVRGLDVVCELNFEVVEQPKQISERPVKIHKEDMNIEKSHKTYFEELMDLQLDPEENELSDSEEDLNEEEEREIPRHSHEPKGKCCDEEH